MDFIRKAVKLGNSAGVILPKKLLGADVKVIVISRPINIRKVILKILSPYFKDISGIYILNKKPLEVLAITSDIKEIIEEGKVKISLVPLQVIKKDISNPLLRQKILNSEVILNKNLLQELRRN